MYDNADRLNYLITRYINRTCTRQEFDELFEYMEDPSCEDVIKNRLDFDITSDKDYIEISKQKWDSIYNRIAPNKGKKETTRTYQKFAVAAAVIILFIAGGIVWKGSLFPVSEIPYAVKMDEEILPGQQKAILTLADGSQVVLDDVNSGEVAQEGNTAIRKEADGAITYQYSGASEGESGEVFMNTLSTPAAAQYMVILPDKSKVWLNSMSSLIYASEFKGSERVVQLKGEAYFEITKDAEHPFIVKTDRSRVKVLGTHFNVSDYMDEDYSAVTLCEGSVQLEVGENEQLMIPGQQATFANEGVIHTQKIDVSEVIDWTQGYFLFDNADVDHVISKIRRWYNIDVEYIGEKPSVTFTGMVSRDSKLSKILNLLQSTGGVIFEINEGKIIVEKE